MTFKYFCMFMIGFISGLPFLMTLTVFDVWLKDSGFSNSLIGLMTIISIPYILKFLWAPFIDHIKIPILANYLGNKKAWTLLSQLLIVLSFWGMSLCNPTKNILALIICTSIAAFAISCQNIALYSFQIDNLKKQEFGSIASFVIFGYRIGMLVSSSGSLFFADYFGWNLTYKIMAIFVLLCSFILIFIPEPKQLHNNERKKLHEISLRLLPKRIHPLDSIKSIFLECLILPFCFFMKNKSWILYLFITATFKAGDVMAHKMSKPLYIELGFSKTEIASVVGIFGILATIIGGFLGGYIVKHLRVKRSLLLCGIIHAFANLAYLILYLFGHNIFLFYSAVAIENISGGMMMTAFLSFLYKICSSAYPATQYALLWGVHGLAATMFRGISGFLVDICGWVTFYILSFLVSLPSIISIYLLISKTHGFILSERFQKVKDSRNDSGKDVGSCGKFHKRGNHNP